MKIILFHPRGFTLQSRKKSIRSLACIMPPVGILSIAAVLKKAGHDVTVLDGALDESITNAQWAARMAALRPAMVGFSATTSAFTDGYDVCRRLKEISPKITTVFGGVHVSWGKGLIVRDFPAIDLVVAGEGEGAMERLASGESSKGSEELPHVGADLPRVMTARALVYQRSQPVQPVLRPVATELAPSPPTSLSARPFRVGCLTTHSNPRGGR